MEINGVGFKTAAGESGAAQSLAENYDTFLALLTTQLQNQDPLDPLDNAKFTEQLVQFSSVEQAITTNQKLDDLLELQAANQMTGAVSYIGRTAEFVSDKLLLSDGAAKISYGLDDTAAQTTISIVDASGRVVRTVSGATGAGRHEFSWDGLDDNGNQLADGVYNFSVTAVTADNETVGTVSAAFGEVTGVEIVEGVATLIVGDLGGVTFEQIFAIRENESEA
jgi:flagellar basal-body rod modification protein FlgD